jgi:hypothetical protein
MYLHGEGAAIGLDKVEPVLTDDQQKLSKFLVEHAKYFYSLGCIKPPEGGDDNSDNLTPVWPGMTIEESELFVDFRRRLVDTDTPLDIFARNYVGDLSALGVTEGEVA